MNDIKYDMILTKKDQQQSLTKLKDQFDFLSILILKNG